METTCTFLLLIGLVELAMAADTFGKEPIHCRFFSNGIKKCQRQCVGLSRFAGEKILKKRIGGATRISQDEINNVNIDPLLLVDCSDQPISSKWTANQGYLFDKTVDPAGRNQMLYVGSCTFNVVGLHFWSCRGCDRVGLQPECHIGGEDGYKSFYKHGWIMDGSDLDTISITHMAKEKR